MPRDARLYLDEILEPIANIRTYVAGLDYEAFQQDKKTQDAVIRNLEIVGEAAGRLPETMRTAAPQVEWWKIAGLRNILAHEYFGVSLPVVSDVIKNRFEPLERACRRLLNEAG